MSLTRLLTTAAILCGVIWIAALPAQAATLRQQLDEAIQDYQFQDFDEAAGKFHAVLRQAPGNVAAHYYLGVILLQQGQAAEAIPHLEHVAAAPARYAGINGLLARAYMQTGRNSDAVSLLEQLHRNEPGNAAYTFDYGKALQAAGQYDAAAALFRQLIEKGGNYADPSRYQLSQIHVHNGAYASATAELRAIGSASPYYGAASQYLKSLEPLTRPFNIYLSGEYFYSDNPTSASAALTGTPQPKQGSTGFMLTGMVSSRNLEITPKLRARLSYLFYGNFYQKSIARGSDFNGHFLNPLVSYHPSKEFEFQLKGELQRFRFNQQHLSDNYGAKLTGIWHPEKDSSLKIHGGYLSRRYTGSYFDAGIDLSLKYLNDNVWSVGVGGSFAPEQLGGSSLTLDYTLSDNRPTELNTLGLTSQSSDSRFREHQLRADLTIPFSGALDRLSLLAGYTFSSKKYLNIQSGILYADVAGQKIDVRLHSLNVRLQAGFLKNDMVKASAGFEYAHSKSAASTLTYIARKYFGQLSFYY